MVLLEVSFSFSLSFFEHHCELFPRPIERRYKTRYQLLIHDSLLFSLLDNKYDIGGQGD